MMGQVAEIKSSPLFVCFVFGKPAKEEGATKFLVNNMLLNAKY